MASKYKICLDTVQVNHPMVLLSQLNDLRKSGVLTDVTIVVEGREYHCHKAILAASSDYFRAMFTGDMKEKYAAVVEIITLTRQGFNVLLEYMYTARLNLTETNIEYVVATANYLQMCHILETCTRYLESIMTTDNCVEILSMADDYNLHELKEMTICFMCANITHINANRGIHQISADQMKSILDSDYPMECRELDVLRITLFWMLRAPPHLVGDKMDDPYSILQHIHFSEISPASMRKLLQEFLPHSKDYIWEHPLYQMIGDLRLLRQNNLNFDLINNDFNTRGMVKAVVTIAGFSPLGMTNELKFCVKGDKVWRRLSTIPHVEQCNFGTIVVNNEVYIAGGCYNQCMQEIMHNYTFKYAPLTDKWTKLAPMLRDRCRFSLSAIGYHLYVVGGEIEKEYEYDQTNSCERYNICKNRWDRITPIPENRTQHASVTHMLHGREYVYVSGGLCKDRVSQKVFRYDPILDKWSTVGHLLTPRADHTMVSYEAKIYIAGGWNETGANVRLPVSSIEVFDPVNNTWSVVAHIENPRSHSAVALEGHRLWITGGFARHSGFSRGNAPTLCYDIELDMWIKDIANPETVWEHSSQVMYIPKTKKEEEDAKNCVRIHKL